MNGLSKFLVDNILEESTGQVTALYGGGFKPPTKGHLEVVLKGLQQTPEVNKLKILVGQKERNGFTQDQSVKIWNLYNNIDLIPIDIEIIPVNSPFNYYKEYLRKHPEDKTYVFMGSREGDKDDQFDVKQRSEFIKKYSDNVIPLEISTTGGVSGTEARKLFKTDVDSFKHMFPENLTDNDFKRILNILGKKELDEGQGGADTSWSDSDDTVTLQDILDLTRNIKIQNLPTEKLAKIVLNWDNNPEEIERIDQVEVSKQYPILIMVNKSGKIQWILDGNHRAQKALRSKSETIPAKLIKPSDLNDKARKILTLNESSEDKILYAFDLDDTLITSKSYVIVTNPEHGTFKLTPTEYTLYEPGPDDILDFSGFAHLKNPRVIKDNFELFTQILSKSSQLTGAKTIILTARQPEVSIDLEKFLEKNNLPQVTLHAVGSSDPNEKLNVIQDYINNGFNKIRFYDDSPKNVELIKSLNSPEIDVIAKLVSQGPLAEILKEESDPFGLNQIVKEIMEDEFDYQPHIDSLTTYLKEKGENIEPLPKITFIKDDDENAKGILGKTAYYDPNQQEIILYTYLRHPKDVLRSLAHEFIHHKQNLEGRLGDITTDNTKEDDNLKKIEKEAYTDGNLNFREWTQTLNESLHHIFTKKKIILNERRWTRSDSKVSEQEQTKYWALYSHLFDYLKKGNVDIEDMENQIKSGTKSQKSKQETLNALYYFWKLIEDSEFDTEFGLHKER